MKSNKITNILLILSISVLIFGSGFKLGEYKTEHSESSNGTSFNSILNSSSSSLPKDFDSSLFWDTWNKIQEKYVDKKKVDSKKMFYGAIKGMVASVEDPYTFFLTPDENKKSKEDLQGKFEGIGAQLGLKDNKIVIIAPLKNSPAEKAGARSGDIIVSVDGSSTKGWTLPAAVAKIRGDKGTKVKLGVERNEKEQTLEITRDSIIVPSLELSYLKTASCNSSCAQIAYLKLNQFGDNTNSEWDKTVSQIKEKWDNKEIRGMVLDLRDNPGGYLDSAVYLASEFLPYGKIVVKQESTTTENRTYTVERQGKLLNIPLTVLLNKGSASASEILSGALRDYKRTTLVGEKSFGKGSVQEALDLQKGAGLHVTVAKWILPNGDWINSKGIEPEVKVENIIKDGETITNDTDTQLQKAIDIILKN